MPRQLCGVRAEGSGRQEAGELAAGVGLAGILSRTHAHKDIINCACAAKKERKREQQEVEWMREGGTGGHAQSAQ